MKIVNPKYHIETFRCKRTRTIYFSDANSWDYYNTFTTFCGIYITDILNNYPYLIPHEISENDKMLNEVPNDLFLIFEQQNKVSYEI
jgi:hypothetical protein